jgi:predicted nucleic acid-binding protein
VWRLRENLTPYAAVYVALAEALDAVLLTADRKLERVPGVYARVDVVS